MSLPVGYWSGDCKNGSAVPSRVPKGAYLLVWVGEENRRLDLIYLVGAKVKDVSIPTVLEKVV